LRRLSVADRRLQLSKLCARRFDSHTDCHVWGRLPECLNDRARQHYGQQDTHRHGWSNLHGIIPWSNLLRMAELALRFIRSVSRGFRRATPSSMSCSYGTRLRNRHMARRWLRGTVGDLSRRVEVGGLHDRAHAIAQFRRGTGNFSNVAYLIGMWLKLTSLAFAVCAIGVVSGSWAYAAVSVTDDAAAKPVEHKAETIVAQAWWEAAYSAATAQQQAAPRQAAPWVRRENQRYRRRLR
jgi:hypothetical protein